MIEFLAPLIWLIFVSFSFGFALTREKNFITVGFGISAIVVLSIIFNLIHVPLTWWVFLTIAIGIMVYFWWKKELQFDIKMPGLDLALVLLMAIINIYVYWNGANNYPYLEDDDPWSHAVGTKWVAETGSFSRYFDGTNFYRMYIEPYPPSFDVIMGMLHQLLPSVVATLKFFNAFLIGITLIFAFYFFVEISKDRKLSLFAVFLLLCLPAFMSHFIWAQSLAVLCMFVALYSYEKVQSNKLYLLPTAVAIGAIGLSQPSTAVIFVFISIIYLAVKWYVSGFELIRPILIAATGAVILTALFYVPTILKYGIPNTLSGIGISSNLFTGGHSEDTSSGVVYSLDDFLFVQPVGKIDQQIGIGPIISLLAIIGFISALLQLKDGKKDFFIILTVVLFVFTLIGTEANALPVKLFPHRFWVFLSIPVVLLASYGYMRLEEKIKFDKLLLIVVILLVILTSATGKFQVQTATWPPGASFSSQEQLVSYVQLKSILPINTKIFTLCEDDSKIIGSDMLAEPYLSEYEIFKRSAVNKSSNEVYRFLSTHNYSYLIIDSACVQNFGIEKTQQTAADYLNSAEFTPLVSNRGFLLLRLK